MQPEDRPQDAGETGASSATHNTQLTCLPRGSQGPRVLIPPWLPEEVRRTSWLEEAKPLRHIQRIMA